MRVTYLKNNVFCYRGITHRYYLRNRNTPDCEASFQISSELWNNFAKQFGAALHRIKTAVDIFETGFGWRRVYLKGAVKKPLLLQALFYLLNKFLLRNEDPKPPRTASYQINYVRGQVVGYIYPKLEVVKPVLIDPAIAVAQLLTKFGRR